MPVCNSTYLAARQSHKMLSHTASGPGMRGLVSREESPRWWWGSWPSSITEEEFEHLNVISMMCRSEVLTTWKLAVVMQKNLQRNFMMSTELPTVTASNLSDAHRISFMCVHNSNGVELLIGSLSTA